MSKNIIPEKYIKNSPHPVSFDQLKTILSQMKKCAKISYNNIRGTAFFLEYALKDKKSRKVLVTCGHVLEEKILEEKKILTVSLNNINNGESAAFKRAIHLGFHRKKLCCNKLDLTFIEINENDKIPQEYFFEIDEDYKDGKENFKNISKNKSIYILNCPEGKDCVVSFGVILETKDNDIWHNCNTHQGSSGSAIFSLNSHKVIGVHNGGIKNEETNIGTFLIEGLERFNEHCNSSTNYHKSNSSVFDAFNSRRNLRNLEINHIKPKEKKNIYLQEENPFKKRNNQINSKSKTIRINNSKKSFIKKRNNFRSEVNYNLKYSYSTRTSVNNIKEDKKNLDNKFESNNLTPYKTIKIYSIIENDSTKDKETECSDNKNKTDEKNVNNLNNEKQINYKDKNIKKDLFTNENQLNMSNKSNNSNQRRNHIANVHVIRNINIKRTDYNNVKVITTIYKRKK